MYRYVVTVRLSDSSNQSVYRYVVTVRLSNSSNQSVCRYVVTVRLCNSNQSVYRYVLLFDYLTVVTSLCIVTWLLLRLPRVQVFEMQVQNAILHKSTKEKV